MENKLEQQIEKLEDLSEELNEAAYNMYSEGIIDATDHEWFCEYVRDLIDITRDLKKIIEEPLVIEMKDDVDVEEIRNVLRMGQLNNLLFGQLKGV